MPAGCSVDCRAQFGTRENHTPPRARPRHVLSHAEEQDPDVQRAHGKRGVTATMAPKKVRVRRGGGFPASHHFFTRERPRCDGSVPRPSATSSDPQRGRRPGIRPRERDERSTDDGHGRSRRSEHLEAARDARGACEPATSPRRSTARTATNNRARFGGRVESRTERPSASHRLTFSSPLHSTRRRARVLSVVLAMTPTRLRTPIPRRRRVFHVAFH